MLCYRLTNCMHVKANPDALDYFARTCSLNTPAFLQRCQVDIVCLLHPG